VNGKTKLLLFWIPRVLAILFALFISVFALDVFGEDLGFLGTAAALLIHLIPTFLILIVLAAAWRWEWVGAVAYFFLGVCYLVLAWGKLHWSAYLAISGPLFLLGVLFLLGWLYRTGLRSTSEAHVLKSR
jgi:hypothetical protein